MVKQARRRQATTIPGPLRARLSPRGLLCLYARISGMGLSVVAGASLSPGALAATPPFGSSAWVAQQRAAAALASPVKGGASAPAVNSPTAVTTPQQALQNSARSMANLSRAAAAITAAQSAQLAARQLSLGQANPAGVADGLNVPGGLVVDTNAAKDLADPAGCATYNCSWLNAQLPGETVDDKGHHTVTVEQTAQKAILSWQQFNVGRDTTLHFDQSAGTQADGSNNWIALNRISASASPSRILGEIKAEGSVYLINPSGFIFGGASTVNVHSLLVTTLNPTLGGDVGADYIGSNYTYLTSGVFNGAVLLQPVEPLIHVDSPSGLVVDNGQTPVPIAMGDIEIQAGASLKTEANGYALIAAPNVRNAGQIVADDGQAVLAAGSGMTINTPSSSSLSFSVSAGGQGLDAGAILPPGEVLNTGLIQARRGSIQLVGSDVTLGSAAIEGTGQTQYSTIVATTSLTRPGNIVIKADNYAAQGSVPGYTGVVDMQSGSTLALLPDYNGETTTSSAAADAAFKAGSISITGGSIRMMGTALIEAPGQNVSLNAVLAGNSANTAPPATGKGGAISGRIYLDDGAVIDVSGLANIELAMAANLVVVPRLGQNELADSPLQRDGILFGSPVTVDAREHGTREDGSIWYGTPVANVNGYVELVSRGIAELLLDGGSIELKGQEVIAQSGSQLNLDGGYKHYLGGSIQTTRLLAANGAIIDIADADPDQIYQSFAGTNEVEHTRANLTEIFHNSPLAGQAYESDYIEGGNAGTLSISLSGYYADDYQPVGFTQVLDGSISARAYAGRHQVADGRIPSGGSFSIGKISGGSAAGGATLSGGALSYLIVDQATPLAEPFGYDTAMPEADSSVEDPWNHPELAVYWSEVSSSQLADAGFSNVSLITSGAIRVQDSGLQVQPGGHIDLTASVVRVGGDLIARSGSISVTALGQTADKSALSSALGPSIFVPAGDSVGAALPGNIEVLRGVTLSTRGFWINDTDLDADHIGGAAFINGGRISLVTAASVGFQRVSGDRNDPNGIAPVFGPQLDLTGSVLLAAGSTLDVSSGGRVLQNGRLATSKGIALGHGGDIELAVYTQPQVGNYQQPKTFVDIETGAVHAPSQGRLQVDGSLLGYGFAGGGELRLQALGFRIGDDTATSAPEGTMQLSSDFFGAQGFSSYELVALYNTTISDGSLVRPAQYVLDSSQAANYSRLLGASTGSDVYQLTTLGPYVASDGLADDYGRYLGLKPTSLAVYSGGYLSWTSNNNPGFEDYSALCDSGEECITGTTYLGAGASIQAENGASVTLGSLNQVTVLGSIVAHAGHITLTGDNSSDGYAQVPAAFAAATPYASDSKSVWLGSSSVLDVSGLSLVNRLAAPQLINGRYSLPHTGLVLDGGSVTLTNDTGYVLARAGSRIDVSGATDVFDLRTAGGSTAVKPQAVWSDAGSIVLGAGAGLYFDGSLSAQAGFAADGSGHGRGGSLTIAPESVNGAVLVAADGSTVPFGGAQRLVISQHGVDMPVGGLSPGATVEASAAPSGDLHLAADLLDGSGIDDLYLGQDPLKTEGLNSLPIVFAQDLVSGDGNIRLLAGRSIVANAATIGTDAAADGLQVLLSAPYVALHGYVEGGAYTQPTAPLARDNMRLTVAASAIDLGGVFTIDGFSDTRFISQGDLRFSTPSAYTSGDNSGALLSGGDLHFDAARIYPATGNRYIVAAVGNQDRETTISFGLPEGVAANTATPLSAGGSLLVDATHIIQAGVIRAPQGQIVLGVSDPNDSSAQALFASSTISVALAQTASVQLAAGSLTSISLDGAVVPYGSTVDGADLLYDLASGASAYLKAPPSKSVGLAGLDVALDDGALVDLSGGGDLQAQEFVAGTGGSKDVLAGSGVYAILPGDVSKLAAYDPELAADPLIGQAVHLSGVPGLPEGDYTLLPARYATLPGAYRVVQASGATDSLATQNVQLADGTQFVAGYFTDRFSGARDSRSTGFFVQSTDAKVWQQYSEYTLTSADAFFAAQAARAATVVPQLPRDAGRLVIAPTQTLSALDATLDSAAGVGGASAQVDIASAQIQIIASGESAAEGYVGIAAADLSALNAGSLLIGGTRTRDTNGDLITPIASSVVVGNGTETLYAPEVLLVAQGIAGQDSVVVGAGSQIEARGSASAAAPITVGRVASGSQSAVSGDGALLRISNGGEVVITRANTSGDDSSGVLVIGAGSSLLASADQGSITLDSSGRTQLDASAGLSAHEIAANSSLISFLGEGVVADADANGIVVSAQTLAQLSSAAKVTLNSRGAANFIGDVNLDFDGELSLGAAVFNSDGGDVAITAQSLTLGNLLTASAGTASGGEGSLQLNSEQLSFSGSSTAFSGFSQIEALAAKGVLTQAKGRVDFGAADVGIDTPIVIADAGSSTVLAGSGELVLNSSGGADALKLAPLGGSLSLQGASVSVDTTIQALAGRIALQASSGDVAIGSDALLSVHGATKTYFDVDQYASAGSITLESAHGDIVAASGSRFDFAAQDAGGDAGALKIVATGGELQLAGTLAGGAVKGQGGSLSLDVDSGLTALDSLAANLAAAGVDQTISIRTRSGDLSLASDLKGDAVALTADGGSVTIAGSGVIDASGAAGGSIALYGRDGVELQGLLDAHATGSDQRGGDVTIGTTGTASGEYDAQYGYQLVDAAQSGSIVIGAGAVIDVGGTDSANALSGGSVHIRAPLLSDGSVKVAIDPAARGNIKGARDVSLEAYATWSTLDATTGAQHFDGIVDPAGLYDADGVLLASGGNAAHSGFYADTLLNFVRDPQFAFGTALEAVFGGIANFHARPGIDLINPDVAINGGDIRVLSNWNLGAGTQNPDGSLDLLYRYQDMAPVLSLRAAGDALFMASLSDGFFQYNNPFAGSDGVIAPLAADANGISPQASDGLALPLLAMSLAAQVDASGKVIDSYDSSSYRIVAGADFGGSDPLALSAAALEAGRGDVIVDGHRSAKVYSTIDGSSRTMVAPTMIRSGAGSISVAAADDIELRDDSAPGVIYTAGQAAAGTKLSQTADVLYTAGAHPWLVDTGESHAIGAGDLTLLAGGDIVGTRGVTDTDGSRTGVAGVVIDQYWWPWMQGLCNTLSGGIDGLCSGDTSAQQYGLINFANFDQGVLSAGGKVSVAAGGSITDFSVSLPTTYVLDANAASGYSVLGGGSLSVQAGNDILGGDFFVSNGTALISAGGRIAASGKGAIDLDTQASVSTLLALQNAQMTVRARLGVEIGDVLNPSYMSNLFDVQPYGSSSSLRIETLTGDLLLARPSANYGYGISDAFLQSTTVWPATLEATAFNGALTLDLGRSAVGVGLSASPTGQLSLLATDTVTISSAPNAVFGLFDIEPSRMASPGGGSALQLAIGANATAMLNHEAQALHAADTQPVLIYSLDGDIIDTLLSINNTVLLPNKPAQIRAGRDIVNLNFVGQNLYDSDMTVIAAGRDLYFERVASYSARIEIGGPGTLLLSAGRDIGPVPPSDTNVSLPISGFRSVGNRYNPYQQRASGADLLIEFGVAPGVAVQAFAAAYIAPDRTVDDVPSYTDQLIAFVRQIQLDQASAAGVAPPQNPPSAEQAWALFQQLPVDQQKRLAYAVLYDVLDQVGLDYNQPSSDHYREYSRGYAAIAALFPPAELAPNPEALTDASLPLFTVTKPGYTVNNLDNEASAAIRDFLNQLPADRLAALLGDLPADFSSLDKDYNGALYTVATGSFDMRGATVQTQQGGDISLIAPGGGVLVGSTSAAANTAPSRQGLLALQTGSINVFTDQSTLLAQSRIFTEQGGDILIWSSNGDINAGKGAKTSSELPTTTYLCDNDRFCLIDASGQVSGAGIATLQTVAGLDAGDANLVAPAGTVDAGDAGIRAGNLNIAALQVANADNIQVQGNSVGVPSGVVNTAALGAASAAAAAANDAAQDLAKSRAPDEAATMITVDVLGFGAVDEEERRRLRSQQQPQGGQ
ncbi:filamentous haemagglutinin family protein [Hydrocarboniphaga sp.]|uniref:filamentous haemagglutinin family protein n=1 Tax=Hydrocarboniphaga sp. TaxID=2033016 RepID=UPI003D0E761F